MSIKIALCDNQQSTLDEIQALIHAHPQGALFEVSCFLTAKEVFAHHLRYNLLMTTIEKAPTDLSGLELANLMSIKMKIILYSDHSPDDVYQMTAGYNFEILEYIQTGFLNFDYQVERALDKYLNWKEIPWLHHPFKPPNETPPFKPSVTWQIDQETKLTLYLNDILYLTEVTDLVTTKTIITTTHGDYTIKDGFEKLPVVFERDRFYAINDGIHLVNLNYCTLSEIFETLTLILDNLIIYSFPIWEEEYPAIYRYFKANGSSVHQIL